MYRVVHIWRHIWWRRCKRRRCRLSLLSLCRSLLLRRFWLGWLLLGWLFLGLLLLRLLLLLLSFLLLLRKLLHSGLFWLLRKGFEVLKLMLIEMVLHVMRSQVRRRCRLRELINGSLHLNCNWGLHLNCRLIHVGKTRRESWQWIVVLKNLVLHMGYE